MSTATPVFSKNLNGSCELTLLAKLKSGFVALPDPMTYTTRLELLLAELFDTRKGVIERGTGFLGPLERLRTIHFVRWALVDRGERLLLAVTFDRPWEPYIRRIVEEAGPLLDVIFAHCEGYDGHSCRDGYSKFAQWVRERQQECEFFFAAFPGQTVDDLHALMQLKSNLERLAANQPTRVPPTAPASTLASLPLDSQLTELNVAPPGVEEYSAYFRSAVGLYRLRSFFPATPVPDPAYSDRAIFDRACGSILSSFGSTPPFPRPLAAQYDGLPSWYTSLFATPDVPPLSDHRSVEDAQRGILEAHATEDGEPMTHGCAVLLQFGENTRLFLESLRLACNARKNVHYNVGFTFQGLKKLGLSAQALAEFPLEFQQGMMARAGLLGDVSSNHPETWRLPRVNFETPTALELQLSDVDAVVLLQTRAPSSAGDHLWSAEHPLHGAVILLGQWGAQPLHVQPLRRYEEAMHGDKFREHFGFLDGFGQPEVARQIQSRNDIMTGEVLLGHPNDSGEILGEANPILNNGSFLVMRKLSQDVASFKRLTDGASRGLAEKMVGRTSEGVPLAAPEKCPYDSTFNYDDDVVGARCPLASHARLSNPRARDKASIFGRSVRTPRILRRGFSYGSRFVPGTEQEERGLLFMAYNASIAQQYEVIQRWLNGANGTGLDSSQRDPLTGAVSTTGGRTFRYRNGTDVVTVALPDQPLAKLEWGMYVFVPSLTGLAALLREYTSSQSRSQEQAYCPCELTPDEQAVLGRGQTILAELMRSPHASDWRAVLEEQGAVQQRIAFATLAAIRANHRVLRTPLGVLVMGAEEALEALTREESFSVREYYRRMQVAQMPMHLGMDARPIRQAVCPAHAVTGQRPDEAYVRDVNSGVVDYARESIANGYIDSITRLEAFLLAEELTERLLDSCIAVELDTAIDVQQLATVGTPVTQAAVEARVAQGSLRVAVDLTVFAQRIISLLSQEWFSLPDGREMLFSGEPADARDQRAFCPVDFTVFSLYVFRPDPDAGTAALAGARGAQITAAARRLVAAQLGDNATTHQFLRYLNDRAGAFGLNAGAQRELVVRSLVGTVDGFVAASYGSFLSVIEQWLEEGQLFRVQRRFSEALSDALLDQLRAHARERRTGFPAQISNDDPFVSEVIKALKLFPKPPWLHRVAVEDTVLGGVEIKRGDRVSIHLGQTALEQPGNPQLLFGGPYDRERKIANGAERTPLHACPAREMALGVVLGMLVAVLRRKNLTMESRLALRFEASREDIERVRAAAGRR